MKVATVLGEYQGVAVAVADPQLGENEVLSKIRAVPICIACETFYRSSLRHDACVRALEHRPGQVAFYAPGDDLVRQLRAALSQRH